jgi:hypothetical protein
MAGRGRLTTKPILTYVHTTHADRISAISSLLFDFPLPGLVFFLGGGDELKIHRLPKWFSWPSTPFCLSCLIIPNVAPTRTLSMFPLPRIYPIISSLRGFCFSNAWRAKNIHFSFSNPSLNTFPICY